MVVMKFHQNVKPYSELYKFTTQRESFAAGIISLERRQNIPTP